jgi:hypothetical protein
MSRHVLLPLLTLAALLGTTGCSGDEDAMPTERLTTFVLQPADVPDLTRSDEGPIAAADVLSGPRRDPQRFGRAGGWQARYRAPASASLEGPFLVESRVDLFENAGGAEWDLDAYRSQLATPQTGAAPVDVERVGDESLAVTVLQPGSPRGVRSYTVAWRQGNVTASVLVQGFEDGVSVADALALARKQAKRIEDSLGQM